MSQSDSIQTKRKTQEEDPIQLSIGNFGRWQLRISILMALLKFPIAWLQLSIVFLAPPTQFWCKSAHPKVLPTQYWLAMRENNYSTTTEGLNTGYCTTLLINNTVSTILRNNTDILSNQNTGSTSNLGHLVPCPYGHEYNISVYYSSIITEWDLVCGNKRLVDLSQIVLMLGVLVGNIVFGVYADRSGRKRTLLVCIFFQSVFGIVAACVPWYWAFVVARFALAVANGGTMVVSFVMCMEVVGGVWRTIIPILYQIPFAFGNSMMAGLAYVFRDWRHLQMALSVLSALYIVYFWFIPESPRWLLAVGRKEEAEIVLKQAAKCNRINAEFVRKAINETTNNNLTKSAKNNDKVSISTLFSNRILRRRSIILCINWLIVGVTFYAFSQYAGKVGKNLYFTAAVSGFVAFPGTIACVFITRKFGRRVTIASAHLLTAVCFFAILAVPTGVYVQDWPRVAIAGVGIVGLSISMPALYLFTGELFPTMIRNAGVGFTIMFSRIGSMIAPLVVSMQDISPYLPLVILGASALVESALIVPLPETKGTVLPDKIEDLENLKDGDERVAKKDYSQVSTLEER